MLQSVLQINRPKSNCIRTLSDERIIIGTHLDNNLRIFNIKTTECELILEGHTNLPICVNVLPNGDIISGSSEGEIKIWTPDFASKVQKCSTTLIHVRPYKVHGLVVLPDGKFVSIADGNLIIIWNPKCEGTCISYSPVFLIGHTGRIKCAILMSDLRLISGSHDTTLKVWDLNTTNFDIKPIMTLEGHSGPISWIKIIDNNNICSGSKKDASIKIWNLEKDAQEACSNKEIIKTCTITSENVEMYDNSFAVLPDGSIISCSITGNVKIWKDYMQGETQFKTIYLNEHRVFWAFYDVTVWKGSVVISGWYDEGVSVSVWQ